MGTPSSVKQNPWGQAWVLLAALSPFLYHPLALLLYGWAAKATEWKRAWLGNPDAEPVQPFLREAYFQVSFPILPALGIFSLALVFSRLSLNRASLRHPAWALLLAILVSTLLCAGGSYALPLTQSLEYAAAAAVPLAAWMLTPEERELLKRWSLRSLALWWLICMLYCRINHDKGLGANPNWTSAALAATAPFAWLQLCRLPGLQSPSLRLGCAALIAGATLWQILGPCSTRTALFALPFLAVCLLFLRLPGWRSRLAAACLAGALLAATGLFLHSQMQSRTEAEARKQSDLLSRIVAKFHRLEAEDIRAPLWKDALRLGLEKPAFGHGPLGWLRDFPGKISENLMKKQHFSSLIEHTHNQPLMILVELGLLGLLAWSATLLWLLLRRPADDFAWCAWSGAVLLLGFGMADKPLAVAASAPIFLLLLALLSPPGPASASSSRLPGQVLAAVTFAFGFFFCLCLGRAALAKLEYEIRNEPQALETAAAFDRWNPDYAYLNVVQQVHVLGLYLGQADKLRREWTAAPAESPQKESLRIALSELDTICIDQLERSGRAIDQANRLAPGYGDLQRRHGVWATYASLLSSDPAQAQAHLDRARQAYEKNLAFQPLSVNRLVAMLEFTSVWEPQCPRLADLQRQLPELLVKRITWKSLDQGVEPRSRATELRRRLQEWQPGQDPSPVIDQLNAMIDTGKFLCQADPGWKSLPPCPRFYNTPFTLDTCIWLKSSMLLPQPAPASFDASRLEPRLFHSLAREVLLAPDSQGAWTVLRPGDKLPAGPLYLADWPGAFTVQGLYAAAALSLDGGATPPLELPSTRRHRLAKLFQIDTDRIQIWTPPFDGLP